MDIKVWLTLLGYFFFMSLAFLVLFIIVVSLTCTGWLPERSLMQRRQVFFLAASTLPLLFISLSIFPVFIPKSFAYPLGIQKGTNDFS
jgi:hypothetical protein